MPEKFITLYKTLRITLFTAKQVPVTESDTTSTEKIPAMSEMPYISAAVPVRPRRPQAAKVVAACFTLEETYSGYGVVPEGAAPLRIVLLQAPAMLSDAAFIAGSVALIMMSWSEDFVFLVPVIMLILTIGVILMWFASRGTVIHIEVDTMNGEVREVARNPISAQTVMLRYGFDCVGSVFVQHPGTSAATLVLRYRNTARTVAVASRREQDLSRLGDLMGCELIVSR
jgi:hypothetical protein